MLNHKAGNSRVPVSASGNGVSLGKEEQPGLTLTGASQGPPAGERRHEDAHLLDEETEARTDSLSPLRVSASLSLPPLLSSIHTRSLTFQGFPPLCWWLLVMKWATAPPQGPCCPGGAGEPRRWHQELDAGSAPGAPATPTWPRESPCHRTPQPHPHAPCPFLLPGPTHMRRKPRRGHPPPLPLCSSRTGNAPASPSGCLPGPRLGHYRFRLSTDGRGHRSGFFSSSHSRQAVPTRRHQPEQRAAQHPV